MGMKWEDIKAFVTSRVLSVHPGVGRSCVNSAHPSRFCRATPDYPGQLISLLVTLLPTWHPGLEGRGKTRHPAQGCGPLREKGGRLLPSPSLRTSLSSWGLEGHMAEIHRCFSLLEKGGHVITTCKLHFPRVKVMKQLGNGV